MDRQRRGRGRASSRARRTGFRYEFPGLGLPFPNHSLLGVGPCQRQIRSVNTLISAVRLRVPSPPFAFSPRLAFYTLFLCFSRSSSQSFYESFLFTSSSPSSVFTRNRGKTPSFRRTAYRTRKALCSSVLGTRGFKMASVLC